MENTTVPVNAKLPLSSLTIEVRIFVQSLPEWAKYICYNLLSGLPIQDEEVSTAYRYLLEDSLLIPKAERPGYKVTGTSEIANSFKSNLLLAKLENVEGVNALAERQMIEFSPNLTVLYGSNGSGKSGYVRLLNNAFVSKGDKSILPNIYAANGHKNIKAGFGFISGETNYNLQFPIDAAKIEFKQFSVFDSKSIPVYLNNRNQFEFRPSGLNFFGQLIEVFKKVEEKLVADINTKNVVKDYSSFFDGESVVKSTLTSLSEKTKIEDLKKYLPFTEDDTKKREILEERKANLQSMKKDKAIADLEEKKQLAENLKKNIESNNKPFTADYLLKVGSAISGCVSKQELAKKEGIAGFETHSLKQIGGPEWKIFIESAEKFASTQLESGKSYPNEGDACLLCHQPLSVEAKDLIKSYWAFLKSTAEKDAKEAQAKLDKAIEFFSKMKFDLLPADTILAKWMKDEFSDLLVEFRQKIEDQRALCDNLIEDLKGKIQSNRQELQMNCDGLDKMIVEIGEKIKRLKEQEPTVELNTISVEITLLNHRDKLQQHLPSIESYIKDLKWAANGLKVKKDLSSRKITEKEKELAAKYFNQSYIETFNKECARMDGKFGIEISHTGAAGTSYRQLFIKGKQPSLVLSEGEQKVISLADFISENALSESNKGLIFDDPVTSLDEERKTIIARRLVEESKKRQIIIFTHDLVFVSGLATACEDLAVNFDCHWIENSGGKPGVVYLRNAPSFEKQYKKAGKAQHFYEEAKKGGPAEREEKLKNGFAALRTSYESLVVFDLFKGVVQRFNERVSVDSLTSVFFDVEVRDELLDSFYQCCRYMEGHSHSDKYAYKKPTVEDLAEEIKRFNAIKKKIADLAKSADPNK